MGTCELREYHGIVERDGILGGGVKVLLFFFLNSDSEFEF